MAALKEILAEFGFKLDDRPLKRGQAMIVDATKKTRELIKVAGDLKNKALETPKVAKFATFVQQSIATARRGPAGLIDDLKKSEIAADGLGKKFVELAEKGAKFGAAIAFGFAVKQIRAIADEVGMLGDSIAKTSRKIGVDSTALQEWTFVAESLGIEQTKILEILKKTNASIAQANKGSQEQAGAFRKLGVDFRKASPEEVFEQAISKLSEMTDQGERSRAAMAIFGEQFTEINPILALGSKGLGDLRKHLHEIGGVLDKDVLDQSEEYAQQLGELNRASLGLKSTIVGALLPAINWSIQKYREGISWLRKMSDGTKIVEVGLVALGLVGVKALLPLIPILWKIALAFAPLALKAALLTAVVLLVEDLIQLFTGGESVVGDFMEALFPNAGIVQSLRDIYDAIVLILGDILEGKIGVEEFWKILAGYAAKDALIAIGDLIDGIAKSIGGWIMSIGPVKSALETVLGLFERIEKAGKFLSDKFGIKVEAADLSAGKPVFGTPTASAPPALGGGNQVAQEIKVENRFDIRTNDPAEAARQASGRVGSSLGDVAKRATLNAVRPGLGR